MKLKEYIKNNNFTLESFSGLCDVSYSTFIKWVYAKRIPSRNYMIIIYRKTNGKVSPNDFYDLEDK